MEILTKQIAIEYCDSLDESETIGDFTLVESSHFLGLFTHIEDEAAEVLAGFDGLLGLWGLSELGESAARFLGEHRGELELLNLKHLSEAAARGLSRHEGKLALPNLENPSEEVIASLARSKGKLVLSLPELSKKAALHLATHQGELDIGGTWTMSDAAAECLSQHRGTLWLPGLFEISCEQARKLSGHSGPIRFLRLQSVPRGAESLFVSRLEMPCQPIDSDKNALERLGFEEYERVMAILEGLTPEQLDKEAAFLNEFNAMLRRMNAEFESEENQP